MNCPHCGKELKLNDAAVYNVEIYGNPATAVALCCGKGVRILPIRSYKVAPYTGSAKQDDWGYTIKRDGVDILHQS